jgi:hypothetical protein
LPALSSTKATPLGLPEKPSTYQTMFDCGKRIYHDRRDMVSAIKKIMRRRKNRPKNLRGYYCDRCHGWHLTHQEQRDDDL